MTIGKELQAVIDAYYQSNFPVYSSCTPVALRACFNEAFKKRPKPPEINIAKIITKNILGPEKNSLTLKIYYPLQEDNLPALMYFHGGGFVIRDDMEVYDYTCRLVASKTRCVVIAVDYRLAPEDPFPAAPEDCYQATCWVASHALELGIDVERLAVWGESCGGNLATVVAQMARDRYGPKLCAQMIISSMLDVDFNRPSYQHYENGYILTKDTMQWFWKHYLAKEEDSANPYAVPIHAQDLNNLPPALVITTEYDVLRDEGEYYSKQLQQAGVATKYCCYSGLIHGFFDLYHKVPEAKAACDDVIQKMKSIFLVS